MYSGWRGIEQRGHGQGGGNARPQHALKVGRVVGLEHGGLARQVQVPQAREPEAQGGGARQGGQQCAFLRGQGAHGLIGLQQGAAAFGISLAGGQIHTPVVQADSDVKQPGVHTGKIKIKDAGELRGLALWQVLGKHGVVAEQVGMDGAARQCAIGREGGHMVLVGQLALEQVGLGCVHKRQHHRHGLVPPGQGPQVGLLHLKAASGQVHARQHLAQGGAVGGGGCEFALALEAVHHGSGFAAQAVQHIAIAVGRRVGHGNAMHGQVLHQPQVKRELLRCEPLEQGQHIGRLVGGDEVIGVFNAPGAALQVLECAQIERLQKGVGLSEGDLCVYRHA